MGCPSRLNHRSVLSSQSLVCNSQRKSITNTVYAILTASLFTIRDSEFTGTKINKSLNYEMKEWMRAWMGDCMGGWLHGWVAEWVDDSMDE